MRLRVAVIVALLAVVAGVVLIGGWWYVKDRQRIGQEDLQAKVAAKAGGTSATCVKKDSDGAHWLCAVTTTGAPGRCFRAHVRPWGSVGIVNGYRKCLGDPTLHALVVKKKVKKEKTKA
jgi:hypothetical protein